jgi:hypothetical protein
MQCELLIGHRARNVACPGSRRGILCILIRLELRPGGGQLRRPCRFLAAYTPDRLICDPSTLHPPQLRENIFGTLQLAH